MIFNLRARASSWFIGLISLWMSNLNVQAPKEGEKKTATEPRLRKRKMLKWVHLFKPFMSGVLCLLFQFSQFVVFFGSFSIGFFFFYFCYCIVFSCVLFFYLRLVAHRFTIISIRLGTYLLCICSPFSFDFCPLLHSLKYIRRCLSHGFRHIIRSLWSIFRCFFLLCFFCSVVSSVFHCILNLFLWV